MCNPKSGLCNFAAEINRSHKRVSERSIHSLAGSFTLSFIDEKLFMKKRMRRERERERAFLWQIFAMANSE